METTIYTNEELKMKYLNTIIDNNEFYRAVMNELIIAAETGKRYTNPIILKNFCNKFSYMEFYDIFVRTLGFSIADTNGNTFDLVSFKIMMAKRNKEEVEDITMKINL